jgi:hypothetical protein
MASRRTDWLAGAATGVFGGLLTAIFPIVGIAALLLFVAIAAGRASRLLAWSGLLIGFGGGWTALLLRAVASCSEFDAVPGQDCIGPDLTGWLIAGFTLLVSGLALLVVGLRRAR